MSYVDKELEKLERQQREFRKLKEQDDIDRYNQPDSKYEIQDFKSVTESDIEFAPVKGTVWSDYYTQIKIYAKINAKKNIDTHVNNPYKVWHSHKLPLGCFMCSDTDLISVLVRVIGLMSSQYPDTKF